MTKILQVENVSDYEDYVGYKGLHPLVSVIPYSVVTPIRHSRTKFSVYALFYGTTVWKNLLMEWEVMIMMREL